MKRSQIQNAVKQTQRVLEYYQISLPPFAHWDMLKLQEKGPEIDTIKKAMLGWDVTDFGNGDFDNMGAVLFTLRNGVVGTNIGTPYAEKLIVLKEKQRLPIHMHKAKTEDIISRAGAPFEIRLWNTGRDGLPDSSTPVTVFCDGVKNIVRPGAVLTIENGQSITLTSYIYHTFWGGKGGMAIIGEVSSVNDDNTDNYFAEPVSRFAAIEEDAPRTCILCNEYECLRETLNPNIRLE